jgi:hypothetical protein
MPIKFRCKHCDQLLGISRSRASAVVDCPRCGRSLRVPELDGRIRRLPDPQSAVKSDSALLSALTELSVLDQDDPDSASADPAHGAGQGALDADDHIVSLEPTAVSEPVEVEISQAAAVAAKVSFESGEPIAIAESLNELAALEPSSSGGQVSEDVLREMREASRGQHRMTPLLTSGMAMLLLGVCLGWWIGHQTSDSADSVDESADERPVPEADPPIKARPAGEFMTVQGTVEYQDASGRMLPDAGATVLLLPVDRQGTIMLNARSLKRPTGNPDLVATVAALSALGGDVGLADDDGAYQLTSAQSADCMLIVISQHIERPDDVPPALPLVQIADSWFDSANHLFGRLAVESVAIPQQKADALSTNIQFKARH